MTQINIFKDQMPHIKSVTEKNNTYDIEICEAIEKISWSIEVAGLVFVTPWYGFSKEKIKQKTEQIKAELKNSEVKEIE